jgi:cyclic lactone autoinducer peptide
MKGKILRALAYGLSAVGLLASGASSIGCVVIFWDEPEMPECLIEE